MLTKLLHCKVSLTRNRATCAHSAESDICEGSFCDNNGRTITGEFSLHSKAICSSRRLAVVRTTAQSVVEVAFTTTRFGTTSDGSAVQGHSPKRISMLSTAISPEYSCP